jgi:hypothetical protein
MDIYHGYISIDETVRLMKKFAENCVELQINSIISEVHDVCVMGGYDNLRAEDIKEVTRLPIR